MRHGVIGRGQRKDWHTGYVAGRYRDGSRSDIWTDVTRCAYATFVRYVAACECGWLGKVHPATPAGYEACIRDLVGEHHAAQSAPQATPRSTSLSTALSTPLPSTPLTTVPGPLDLDRSPVSLV